MPKPISQRGFKISKGEYDRYLISYEIDNEGLENVFVHRGGGETASITVDGGTVSITVDNGVVKNLGYSCQQFKDFCNFKNEIDNLKKYSESFNEDSLSESVELDKPITIEALEEKLRAISEEYIDSYQVPDFINSMYEYIFSGHSRPSNPPKNVQERILDIEGKFKQASAIYHEVKRILNVDEELKNYHPRFSHESELNLYNILGIDDVSQIKPFIEEK